MSQYHGRMTSLESSATARRLAKAVTPPIANFAAAARFSSGLDLLVTYLSLINGKGSGSGWDDGELRVAARTLRMISEPVVVDCGANMGTWTEGVRGALGHQRGRWLLVEPVAEYAERLQQLANVTVIAAAAGEDTSVLPLYVPDRPSGWVSLHQRGDSFAQGEEFGTREVQVLKLDDVFRSHDVDHVDFLKMDLEGHELYALRGAGDYLEQGRVAALAFEFGSANVNSRTFFRDFWELLTPLGYTLHRMVPGGRTVTVPRYDETLEFFRGATNYLAILARPGRRGPG
jgi:FkbM family methyltransferase